MNLLHSLALHMGLITGSAILSIIVVRDGLGWLQGSLSPRLSVPNPIDADLIERRAAETQQLGAKPLWEGYAAIRDYPRTTAGSSRRPNQVRSNDLAGRFFAWLAAERAATIVVELGTGFGVSGMYWLAGLKRNGHGRLITFEPNEVWAEIARENLAAISSQFDLVAGTFEDNIDAMLRPDELIDIAFVDAIHTSEIVIRQFNALVPRMRHGGLVLFDDIDFSDDMRSCWQALARDPRIIASATLGGRLGIVELGDSATKNKRSIDGPFLRPYIRSDTA